MFRNLGQLPQKYQQVLSVHNIRMEMFTTCINLNIHSYAYNFVHDYTPKVESLLAAIWNGAAGWTEFSWWVCNLFKKK